ncbi:DNA-binding anti-repressor SinI [Oceanobacillus piezotolerans]|uniref:DNA-binding anti-repressor SinI n=1 Tax=Oceanobacillus piezotolerans TaxID=2448030 RepID=A0A498DII3_9BACI|nr:anti-repressor SinI family protein [Oceanobacillus piezotolerans]RLL48359.1 DNA-binding anti-repressor SinI [Oceanobacillus piezotolerans]
MVTELDEEWIELIEEAFNLGISIQEIRQFLKNNEEKSS